MDYRGIIYEPPEQKWIWVIILVLTIIIFLLVVIIVQIGTDNSDNNEDKIFSEIGEDCSTRLCKKGLICSSNSEKELVCFAVSGQPCSSNSDCLSNFCSDNICENNSNTDIGNNFINTNIGNNFINTNIGNNFINQTINIYNWTGSSWNLKYTLPKGINPDRISSSGNQLLAIMRRENQIYLYNGNSWTNLNTTFSAPGELIDGMISDNKIYLAYRLNNGQNVIFQLINGGLVNITTPFSCSGNQISIKYIDITSDGQIYIVGNIQGGLLSLFLLKSGYSCFNELTCAQLVSANNSGYAFSNDCLVMFVNSNGSRFDNNCNITSLSVDNNNKLWYISNSKLYYENNTINTINNITSKTQVYYSQQDGISIYTPL